MYAEEIHTGVNPPVTTCTTFWSHRLTDGWSWRGGGPLEHDNKLGRQTSVKTEDTQTSVPAVLPGRLRSIKDLSLNILLCPGNCNRDTLMYVVFPQEGGRFVY